MRVALAAGVAALGLLSGGVAADEARLEAARRNIARQAEGLKLPLDAERLDALARESEARFWRGESSQAIGRWLGNELLRPRFAFAPADATHARAARYALPFEGTFPRFVARGPGGEPSHEGRSHHAWDFSMPPGTPVWAARPGRVALVVDGFGPGRFEPRFRGRENLVALLHRDGTFALYVHLQAGIPVQVGERLKRGDLVARSGNSGWSQAPHLHFEVARLDGEGLPQSLPVRFVKPDGSRLRLVPRRFFGVRPPMRGALEVSVGGAPVAGPIPLARGASAELRVRFVAPDGAARDVTRDPATRYGVGSLWNLRSDAPGRVTARPSDGFGETWLRRFPTAVVTIAHGEPGSDRFAWADVDFDLPALPAEAGAGGDR